MWFHHLLNAQSLRLGAVANSWEPLPTGGNGSPTFFLCLFKGELLNIFMHIYKTKIIL